MLRLPAPHPTRPAAVCADLATLVAGPGLDVNGHPLLMLSAAGVRLELSAAADVGAALTQLGRLVDAAGTVDRLLRRDGQAGGGL
jgi:hypothetical protein